MNCQKIQCCFKQKQTFAVLFKIDVLKNFANLTRKHLCWSLFFNKVSGLRPSGLQNVLKKRLQHRCFPVKFARFLRTSIFTEHLWWLLPSQIRDVFRTLPNILHNCAFCKQLLFHKKAPSQMLDRVLDIPLHLPLKRHLL